VRQARYWRRWGTRQPRNSAHTAHGGPPRGRRRCKYCHAPSSQRLQSLLSAHGETRKSANNGRKRAPVRGARFATWTAWPDRRTAPGRGVPNGACCIGWSAIISRRFALNRPASETGKACRGLSRRSFGAICVAVGWPAALPDFAALRAAQTDWSPSVARAGASVSCGISDFRPMCQNRRRLARRRACTTPTTAAGQSSAGPTPPPVGRSTPRLTSPADDGSMAAAIDVCVRGHVPAEFQPNSRS